jgi:anti-sigma B factor antagonist
METLEITCRVGKEGVLILKIVGFIDASNINLFDRRIHEQIEKGYSKIILDCSELQYINSSALGLLLEVHQLAVKRQGGIKILKLPKKIERTFEILGFTEYFQIFSEEEKALQSFI